MDNYCSNTSKPRTSSFDEFIIEFWGISANPLSTSRHLPSVYEFLKNLKMNSFDFSMILFIQSFLWLSLNLRKDFIDFLQFPLTFSIKDIWQITLIRIELYFGRNNWISMHYSCLTSYPPLSRSFIPLPFQFSFVIRWIFISFQQFLFLFLFLLTLPIIKFNVYEMLLLPLIVAPLTQ